VVVATNLEPESLRARAPFADLGEVSTESLSLFIEEENICKKQSCMIIGNLTLSSFWMPGRGMHELSTCGAMSPPIVLLLVLVVEPLGPVVVDDDDDDWVVLTICPGCTTPAVIFGTGIPSGPMTIS
jgi:hypothetical protein